MRSSLRVGSILAAGAALLWGTACAGNVSRGHALYSDGYLVEAAEVFERGEGRLSEWPPETRAAYGLYRGMTLLRLGDLQGASRWLAYARWIASDHPGALPGRELALLHESQRTLDSQLGRPHPFGPSQGAVMVTAEPSPQDTQAPEGPPGEGPAAAPSAGPSTPGAKTPPSRKSFVD